MNTSTPEPAAPPRFGRHNLARYAQLMRWLATDSLLRFRWRSAFIIGSSVLATAMEVQALALVIHYGRLLAADGSLTILGQVYPARTSMTLLAAYAGAVLVALVVGGGLTWVHRVRLLRFRREYEIFCSDRAIRLVAASDVFPPLLGLSSPADGALMKVVRMDARYCGRMMVALLTSVPPVIVGVVACIALLIIDVPLTLLLSVLLAAAVLAISRVGLHGARASRRVESLQPETNRAFRGVVRSARSSSGGPADPSWARTRLFEIGPVRDFFDAYERRLRASEHSNLVSSLLLAACVFTIMVVLGRASIAEGAGWDRLVIYFVALRYALVNIKAVFAKLTNINRFYPQLRRYLDFVSLSIPLDRDDRRLPDLVRGEDAIDESAERLALAPGMRLAVLLPREPATTALLELARGMVGRRAARRLAARSWVLGQDPADPAGPEATPEDLGVPAATELPDALRSTLESILAASAPLDRARRRLGLATVAALAAGREVLLVDERFLRAAGGPDALPGGLSQDLILLVAYTARRSTAPAHGETMIAVTGEDGVAGLGDAAWWKAHEAAGLARLTDDAAPSGRLDDDDEDDDE